MSNFVTVEGRALKRAMTIIRSVIERHNTIPILSHVKLTHSDAGLRLVGTDLDIEIAADLDVIDGAGGEWSLCLSASNLAGIARVAGTMNVRIERTDDKATITLGDGSALYEVTTLPDSDYPAFGGERGTLLETFTNGMFAALLEKVRWCASGEETRYYLNGVCWHITANDKRFVATDGHRMAICKYVKEGGEAATRIIPRKAVRVICEHFNGADVKVFDVSPGRLEIVAPGLTLRTKLIDGTYPDYGRVLPKPEAQEFAFDLKRGEIIAAIDQVTALGSERGRAIRFYSDDGRTALDQRSPDFGNATVKTSTVWPSCAATKAAPSAFGFNGRYLREIAAACQGTISLRMVDQGSPFTFHDADDTMTRVLMPMRV
ncbi:DNA polymerase III subunit beta [Bradyrhizobium sp. SZCCHNS1012]|uniref:DNA polymerase III subunit beta n=1 Tax=Bradyrhizobium sp. SZCCHNS1012 TaxID=3057297 RepID=UPI0029162195|nr:DNA polymerase III subunit beta [Bradyrhizobium sp. SZCCHNS1012]